MKQLRNITIGEMMSALGVYRPFFAMAAIIGLLLYGLPGDDPSRSVDAAGVETDFDGMAIGDPLAPGATPDQTAAGPDGSSGRQGQGGRGATAPRAGAPAAVTIPGGVTFPGVGTEAALSAPDCDPATGRMRMQTITFNLPCVPIWPSGADNGGATERGVTADAIKVVVYVEQDPPETAAASGAAGAGESEENLRATTEGVQALFGRHTELYGRKVELIYVQASGSATENKRADAIQAIADHEPFAAVSLRGDCAPAGFQYQVAIRGVQTICPSTELLSNVMEAEGHYWLNPNGGVMLHEQHLQFTAEFLCKRLQGHPARWAQDAIFQTQQRKFGYLYIDAPETKAATDLFLRQARACGATVDPVGVSADVVEQQTQLVNAVAKFKTNGDNVVILDNTFLGSGLTSKQATTQSYFPEWFATGFGYTDATIFIRLTWDLNQANSLYAMRETSLQTPSEKGDAWRFYQWENGAFPPATLFGEQAIMPVWHMLYAGFHLAGPNLNDQTFAQALLSLPPRGGAYTGGVSSAGKSFGNLGYWAWESGEYTDNTAVDDGVFTWWSNDHSGDDEAGGEGQGMMMFIDGGKRYLPGQIPSGEPDFFNPATAVAQLDALVPAEEPPTYENRRECANRFECWGRG